MRKLLLILVLILILIVTGMVIYKGTSVGDVWGVKQITEKNAEVDKVNSDLSSLVNSTFPMTESSVNSSAKTLEETKNEYEEQAILLSKSDYYAQSEEYKIEYLWTRIGKYARQNNIIMSLEVTNTSIKGLYDLNITSEGKYSDIANFIRDIENDSKLGFKIEDFSMTSGSSATTEESSSDSNVTKSTSNAVVGKFSCKEVRIDEKSLDLTSDSDSVTDNTNTQDGTNTDTNNTTNTTQTQQNTTTKSTSANATSTQSSTTIEATSEESSENVN